MANPSERTANSVTSLTAKSNAGNGNDVILWADPSTHSLLVTASVAISGGSKTNNAAAPTSDNLGVLPAVATAAAPSWTEGNQVLLSTDLSGNLRITGSLSVGGTTDNTAFTAGTSTGTTALGFYHAAVDSVTDGRAAAVAITIKRAQHVSLFDAAGNAMLGQKTTANSIPVALASDATLPVTNAGTFAVQATLAAETTKVIGTVRNGDGAGNLFTSNSTTFTAKFAQDANLLGTLGTAFTTAGKVDVKGADGDVFVRQATGTNLHMVVDSGTITTVSTVTAVTAITNALPAGSNIIGNVRVDQTTPGTTNGVALAQIGSTTTLGGNGVTGAGSLRVTLASDNSAIALWGHGATASSVPANAVLRGGRAATANPTAVTDGQHVGAMADKLGRTVVVVGHVRDMKADAALTLTSTTTETTLIAAVASTFLDVYGMIVTNISATACEVIFRDVTAGTARFSIYVPAGETRGFMLPSSDAYKQATVNTAWTAQCVTSVASIKINALYVKNI